MSELLQTQPRVEAELTQPFAVARRHENIDGNDRRTPLPYPGTSRYAGRRSDRVGNHLVRIVVNRRHDIGERSATLSAHGLPPVSKSRPGAAPPMPRERP